MRVSDAAWLLSAIARGGVIEIVNEQTSWLSWLRDGGYIREAPDPGADRRTMERIKADLAHIAAARATGMVDPGLLGQERGLRSAVVELSERLAASEGATEVRVGGAGGAYRGGPSQTDGRYTLTQRGRVLLSDLAPRATRVGAITVDAFHTEMQGLRDAVQWRISRSSEIAHLLAPLVNTLGPATRSVSIGLSAVRAPSGQIANAFSRTFQTLRLQATPFSVEQDAAAAEALCLMAGDLSVLARPEPIHQFEALRNRLLAMVPGQTEDALDAAVLLMPLSPASHDARLALASELANNVRNQQGYLNLSLSLVALAGDEHVAPHLSLHLAELESMIGSEVPDATERMVTRVLLAFPRSEPRSQVERWRALRQYLGRFSGDGMAVAAALLSWTALDPAETLDLLRMVSASLNKHRLAEGPAETMTHGIKMIVTMACLAAGQDGDPEERLGLGPTAMPRVGQLGLYGAMSALPIAAATVTAFHRTILDAASAWETTYQPTRRSFVHHHRRGGWG